jgi:hypothetical protein
MRLLVSGLLATMGFRNYSHNSASVRLPERIQEEEGFVKTCANNKFASAPRYWAAIGVVLVASLTPVGYAQALKLGSTHGPHDGAADGGASSWGEGVAASNNSASDQSANWDGLDNNPAAFSTALKRRCPEILEDPSSYDDDIVALCLQARKRM